MHCILHYSVLSICILSLSCASCSNKAGVNYTGSEKLIENAVLKSDTLCSGSELGFHTEEYELLNFCQIILNDSISWILNQKIGSGELHRKYNFDRRGSPLEFMLNKDTITIELYYLNSAKNRMVPKMIHLQNDTIYLQSELRGEIDKNFSTTLHKVIFKIKLNNKKSIGELVVVDYS